MMSANTIPPIISRSLLLGLMTMGITEGAVVMNQIGSAASYNFSASPSPTPSQIFTDFPSFDSQVLEDFTVTSDDLEISHVSVVFLAQGGFVSFQNVENYMLNIYSDINLAGVSLVGDIANVALVAGSGATATQINDVLSSNEYGLIDLVVDITLPAAGTYWVGVSPKAATSAGQFFIPYGGATGPTTPGNTDARLANPGEGFATGALSLLSEDYAYSVTSVPELGSAALMVFGGTAFCMRRRRLRPRS